MPLGGLRHVASLPAGGLPGELGLAPAEGTGSAGEPTTSLMRGNNVMALRSDECEGTRAADHTPRGWGNANNLESGLRAAGGGGVRAKRVRWSDEAEEGSWPGSSKGLQAAPERRDAAKQAPGDAVKRRELASHPLNAGVE